MANEIRLRINNVGGVITDNPLTIGATTINSPGFADLPTVDATSHLVLILDPQEVGGPAEIVRVTAHTAASTSCTVLRGQEGSLARSHVFNTTWFHGPVASDFIEDRTSNPTPYEGQFWYRTDTDILMGAPGGVAIEALPLGAWQGWTPALVQGVAVSSTNTSSRFTRIGRTIHAYTRLSVTSAGTAGQPLTITLPTPAAGSGASKSVGFGDIIDVTVATYISHWLYDFGTGVASALTDSSTSAGQSWGVQPNVAIASGDVIIATFTYEAAS